MFSSDGRTACCSVAGSARAWLVEELIDPLLWLARRDGLRGYIRSRINSNGLWSEDSDVKALVVAVSMAGPETALSRAKARRAAGGRRNVAMYLRPEEDGDEDRLEEDDDEDCDQRALYLYGGCMVSRLPLGTIFPRARSSFRGYLPNQMVRCPCRPRG